MLHSGFITLAPEWSPGRGSTLMVGSEPCPQILDSVGSNWRWQTLLLITNTATIIAVKVFIVQGWARC